MAKRPSQRRRSAPPAVQPQRQRPVSPTLFWISMTLTGLCIAVIVWLVVGNVPIDDFGIWPRILLVGLLALFTVASLASTEVIPWHSLSWLEWRQPNVLGTIVYLLLGAVSFVAGVANVFAPPVASEATQVTIRNDVGKVLNRQDALAAGQDQIGEALGISRQSLVRANIAGTWGEPGCAITYRLALNGRSLVMSSLESDADMVPFREEYTIVADADRAGSSGDSLSAMEVNEVGGAHDGQGVIFTYGGNGTSAWLEWKHRSQQINATRFVRC